VEVVFDPEKSSITFDLVSISDPKRNGSPQFSILYCVLVPK